MHQVANEIPEIELSDKAIGHILAYLRSNPGHCGVRFSVKKSGCSGLSYVVDFVSTPNAEDLQKPLSEGVVLCIDKASYPFLKHMQVDYVKHGLNYKFDFKNPNQTGLCGCGESFTVAE